MRPSNKKRELISVTALIPVVHRGLITYLTGSYQAIKPLLGWEMMETFTFLLILGLLRGCPPTSLLSSDPHPLSALQLPHNLV